MLPLGKLSRPPARTARDPRMLDDWQVLTLLARSSLADIPRSLITPEQVRAVLQGKRPEPSAQQRAAAWRVSGGAR